MTTNLHNTCIIFSLRRYHAIHTSSYLEQNNTVREKGSAVHSSSTGDVHGCRVQSSQPSLVTHWGLETRVLREEHRAVPVVLGSPRRSP